VFTKIKMRLRNLQVRYQKGGKRSIAGIPLKTSPRQLEDVWQCVFGVLGVWNGNVRKKTPGMKKEWKNDR